MYFKVKLSGQIRELAGETIRVPDTVNDSEKLLNYLSDKYLQDNNLTLKLTINGILVRQKTTLAPDSQLLVFTPFAGG
jgi:molybdopterin converting factor small subunit